MEYKGTVSGEREREVKRRVNSKTQTMVNKMLLEENKEEGNGR